MNKNLARNALVVLAVTASLLLAGCGDKEPVRIGFLGGVSGRVADLGISGRNAAQLAVDLANQKGGIDGRKIELLVRDDEQNPDVARQRLKELADAKVAAVIGPMTSSIAVAVLPLIEQHKLLTISPTCTANELGGKDDHFLRVVDTARVYADLAARYQYQTQGLRKAVLIVDARNKAYSASWAGDFRRSFEAAGGKVLAELSFSSGDDAGLAGLAADALKLGPDGVVLIGNSVDAALLTQHLRRRAPDIKLGTAEWAATERYVELSGKAAEGVVMAQFFDRSSALPAYLDFRQKYRERFGEEPGFGSVTAYDAANVLIESMSRHPRLSPREAVMAIRRFQGVQGSIQFDPNGDAARDVFVTVIREGKFVVVPRS